MSLLKLAMKVLKNLSKCYSKDKTILKLKDINVKIKIRKKISSKKNTHVEAI